MRTSTFLSTLFAVTTLGGTALAERPIPQREPKIVEHVRAHGDMVDKVYRAPGGDAAARGTAGTSAAARGAQHAAPRAGKAPLDRAASRIHCPDTDVACGTGHRSDPAGGAAAASAGAGEGSRSARRPAFLDKILGNDRTNFNEAGEDQGMSIRAANRIWARAAAQHHTAKMPLAEQRLTDRKEHQDKTPRMSCNEADECSMSSKDAKAQWSYAAVKAGTWTGPERAKPSNAERRITEYRAAEGATRPQTGQQAGQAGAAPAAAAAGADHPH